MAKRKRGFKIPGIGGNKDQLVWIGAGIIGGIGLYMILLNKRTGVPLLDNPIEGVGRVTRLEGKGKGIIPDIDIPGTKQMPVKESAYSSWYSTPLSDDDQIAIA